MRTIAACGNVRAQLGQDRENSVKIADQLSQRLVLGYIAHGLNIDCTEVHTPGLLVLQTYTEVSYRVEASRISGVRRPGVIVITQVCANTV